MSSTRFNPAQPHQAFVQHWTGLARRGELGKIPIARAYRKPLAAELDRLDRGESTDQGARARAILWNGYGSRFIEHLGFRMGDSPRHRQTTDGYEGAVFGADRLIMPVNPDAFEAAQPTLLEPGHIPDLANTDPAVPRVWELRIRGGSRFRIDESRKIHINSLIYSLMPVQRRLGQETLFSQNGKDLYFRVTSPEAVDDFAQTIERPAKHRLSYYGELAPWQDFIEEGPQAYWPISLMETEHDIAPFLGVHPWLFGWHDIFHRDQHEFSQGEGQLMAQTLVRAALDVLPEITEWDETTGTFELLAQMDPIASKPRNVQTLITELKQELLFEMRRHPEAADRISTFLQWIERRTQSESHQQV